MRAVEIVRPGAAEVLQLTQLPAPVPAPGEVLIDVAFAGVNRPDILHRKGLYNPPPGASPLPGLEVSGHIIGLGDQVTGWQIGDQVCALVNGGGYAEQVAVPEGQILPVPDSLPLKQAGAIAETLFTVWSNLVMRAGLRAGETLLIHGGSSGIGTMAIQVARHLGAIPLVTVGTDEKAAFCCKLGAGLAINYRSHDFAEEVKRATDGKGVDVILDMVAGDYIARDLSCLGLDGRLVIIATQGGREAQIDALKLMVKRQTITGATLRPQSTKQKAAIAASIKDHIWQAVCDGSIRPHLHAEFPLDQAAQAHEELESGQAMGKIVLSV